MVENHGISLFKQNKIIFSLVSSIAAVTGFAFCFSQSSDKYCRTTRLLCHSECICTAESERPAADIRQPVPLGSVLLLRLVFQHWELHPGPHARQPNALPLSYTPCSSSWYEQKLNFLHFFSIFNIFQHLFYQSCGLHFHKLPQLAKTKQL